MNLTFALIAASTLAAAPLTLAIHSGSPTPTDEDCDVRVVIECSTRTARDGTEQQACAPACCQDDAAKGRECDETARARAEQERERAAQELEGLEQLIEREIEEYLERFEEEIEALEQELEQAFQEEFEGRLEEIEEELEQDGHGVGLLIDESATTPAAAEVARVTELMALADADLVVDGTLAALLAATTVSTPQDVEVNELLGLVRREIDDETLVELRALGYVESSAADDDDELKKRIAELEELLDQKKAKLHKKEDKKKKKKKKTELKVKSSGLSFLSRDGKSPSIYVVSGDGPHLFDGADGASIWVGADDGDEDAWVVDGGDDEDENVFFLGGKTLRGFTWSSDDGVKSQSFTWSSDDDEGGHGAWVHDDEGEDGYSPFFHTIETGETGAGGAFGQRIHVGGGHDAKVWVHSDDDDDHEIHVVGPRGKQNATVRVIRTGTGGIRAGAPRAPRAPRVRVEIPGLPLLGFTRPAAPRAVRIRSFDTDVDAPHALHFGAVDVAELHELLSEMHAELTDLRDSIQDLRREVRKMARSSGTR